MAKLENIVEVEVKLDSVGGDVVIVESYTEDGLCHRGILSVEEEVLPHWLTRLGTKVCTAAEQAKKDRANSDAADPQYIIDMRTAC